MTVRTTQQARYHEKRAQAAEERAARIVHLIDAGRTYREVGELFGISRGRVYQIVRRWNPERFW